MSISRQRSRTRVNSRSNTILSSNNGIPNTDNATNTDNGLETASFMPSIEESLQDWLSKNTVPDTPSSYSLDMCQCCKQHDCQNFESIHSIIRKLENDVRLAAVIGQSLLQKHEQYVAESNDIKNQLEQEVELLQEKVCELEQSLIESDNLKSTCLEEKNKSNWEWQKTQKILDETTFDLDMCNNRCLQLGAELKNSINEVEKLRVFKFMVRQADIREEVLKTKLEDTKQELAISRKAELTLESKHRKLKAKYEAISIAFEKQKMEQQEMGMTKDFQLDFVWLRESNEKLRKEVLKLTSALLSPHAAAELQMTNNSQNHLIELIKELVSANNKLKTDLLDCTDMLMEMKTDIYHNKSCIDEEEDEMTECFKDCYETNTKTADHVDEITSKDMTWISTSAPQANDEHILAVPRLRRATATSNEPENSIADCQSHLGDDSVHQQQQTPSLPSLTSPTIVHHHYHYYNNTQNKSAQEKGKQAVAQQNPTPILSKMDERQSTALFTLSPSASSTTTHTADLSSPFHQLYQQMITMLQRLTQTDIRALNRQLRRAFDIFELSSMSNSIIENIITDVENLKTRFLWVEDGAIVKQELWLQDVSMIEFFPIMTVVQQMLREISELRMTLNDLQVEYVKKIEESDIRVEREVMRKQQISRQQRKDAQSVGPLAWLFSNVFQRSDSPPLSFLEKNPSDAVVPSYSPFHARFNQHDILSLSSSTPVLSKPKTIPARSSRTAAVDPHKLAIQRHTTLDRQGPSSSYPTRSSSPAVGHSTSKRRSTHALFSSTIHPKQPSFPLRASQSAGTVSRRSHVQAPALEYVVRKKRSALGLNSSSFSTDYNQPSAGDMAGTFTTTWLGNK